ncbi:MAG: hypothetical protein LBS74_10830 [Oscillospiraceae bacterium]|jgi:hypothetical protein|nr:hypothetical protein [Oscillospiraceae bacterium]
MSISLLLVPVAIALGATTSGAAVTGAGIAAGAALALGSKGLLAVAAEAQVRHINHLKELYQGVESAELPSIETIFNSTELLEKTLREHGLQVVVLSEKELLCQVGNIRLEYKREALASPFFVSVKGIDDIEAFLRELECFDREYLNNTQSYTYNKLVESLKDSDMQIAEEALLEDNSILLTIDI